MGDESNRKPSDVDPRGYVIADLPDGLDREAGSAVLRLLARRREAIPESLAHRTATELRAAFVAAGFTDRDLAREVIIGRNIGKLYDRSVEGDRRGEACDPTELVEAGVIDQEDWEACFVVRPAEIDAYLRQVYGDAYGR